MTRAKIGPDGLTARRWQHQRQALMCELRHDGLSTRRIARKLGASEKTVNSGIRRHCERHGLPVPPARKPAMPLDAPMTAAELRVYNAIFDALNGLSQRDLVQFLYVDKQPPAKAVDVVRNVVSRVRRKVAGRADVLCVRSRYFVRTRMAEAAE